MADRVNFNRKKINIKVILIFIVGIFILVFMIKSIMTAYKNVNSPSENLVNVQKYSVDEYTNLEELLYQYSCTYLREVNEDDVLKIYVVFDRNLYTTNKSNESYFMKIIKLVAEFKNFIDIELIDTSKNIDILIKCDGEYINSISINGDINYYLNNDSKINEEKKEIDTVKFTIESKELQNLINNNWSDTINWGTRESICDGYNIYFDEGIKYKKVSSKVFNVIYTEKYQNGVVNGLKPGASTEKIKEALGKPSFEKSGVMLGYLGEENYLFFDLINNQISVYPIQELKNEEEFKKLIQEMNKTNDIKTFVNDLTDLWIDYDMYNYDENYVELQYALLGVRLDISNNSLKNGIYLYQNYAGDIVSSKLENVYVEKTDLVSDIEISRIEKYNLIKTELWYEDLESENYISKKFSLGSRGKLEGEEYGVKGPIFISIDSENADSELDSGLIISSHIWYDDEIIVYAVNNDGIYIYNCVTRQNKKVENINEKIEINSVIENKIIYNNDNTINF